MLSPWVLNRGVYCLLVVATLLDLLTPELVENTADFIASSVPPFLSSQTFFSKFSLS